MIDLNRTREEMLAEIGASEGILAHRLDDASDPEFLTAAEASVIFRGPWAEILPRFETPLARRLADLPPEQFIRDILRPLKMGLGNADKRGHHRDRSKRITVEVFVTTRGVLLAISDEGDGFDVAETLRRFREQESYFTHKGGGFKAFERAGSVISYASGGRQLLIRFLRGTELPSPGLARSEDFMHSVLQKLPMIAKRGRTLESCRIRERPDHRPGQPELRYVLESRRDGEGTRRTILTGRVLTESAARRELTVAKQIYKGDFGTGDFRVPKPMEVFKRHPRLVLYRFDPTMDLTEHLNGLTDRAERDAMMEAVAGGLRALHGSTLSIDVDEGPAGARARRDRAAVRIGRALAAVAPERTDRARRLFAGLEKAAPRGEAARAKTPIHGSFGWDCVRRAVGRSAVESFYVYRFDDCRLSHPGFDVGGFLADLPGSESASAAESFLTSYLAGTSPAWIEALPFFTACAHLERLDRFLRLPREQWSDGIDALLHRCERSLELGSTPGP